MLHYNLGRLLLRENLLVEDNSGFGKGWNKNNFPVSFTTVTKKGYLFIRKYVLRWLNSLLSLCMTTNCNCTVFETAYVLFQFGESWTELS